MLLVLYIGLRKFWLHKNSQRSWIPQCSNCNFLSFCQECITTVFTDKVCTSEPPTSTKGTLLHKSTTNNQKRGETAGWAWCLKAIAYFYFELAGFHQYTTPSGSEPLIQPVAASSLSPPSLHLDFVESLPSSSPIYPLTRLAVSPHSSPKSSNHSLTLHLTCLSDFMRNFPYIMWYRRRIKIQEMQ